MHRFAATKGTCFILSGIAIDDTGGGQRPTQLALELLRQGFRVVFVNLFPKYESKELGLVIAHQNLEVWPLAMFDPEDFRDDLDKSKCNFVLVEFPHPYFFEPVMSLRNMGVGVVYERIDDWQSSLGGDWYSEEVEDEFIRQADFATGSASDLVEYLKQRRRDYPTISLPNAVNTKLFDAERKWPVPADMVKGAPTILFVGSLWGDWIDWSLFQMTAESYPEASVIIIGDRGAELYPFPKPPNVHLLGLKAHEEIPAYMAHSDVALIVFKPWKLSQAVSPLKAFEYLAMGLPIVATDLKELCGLPYTYVSDDPQTFVHNMVRASQQRVPAETRKRLLAEHGWETRVNTLLEVLSR